MNTLKKVVVISPDVIGVQMAGPGVRYWNFAKILSKYFHVVLFTPNECPLTNEGITLERISKRSIKKHLLDASSVVIQGSTLWFHSYIKTSKVPIVVDLYDPFIFENMELFQSDLNMHRASLSIMLDQLQHGDYFICASEKQKDFYLGMLASINRINTSEYMEDKTLASLIGVVPFGIPAEEPEKTKDVIKGVFPGIGHEDKVILWGGGIWDWLDPFTAVQGMELLLRKRDDVKLFFMGVHPPNPDLIRMKHTEMLIELTESLGLKDKYVFFNSWANYEERQNYLLEADIGINLHYEFVETRFAFRTRMLDYIWCNLPVVTTKGDVLSQLLIDNSCGESIETENPIEFANAIEKILENYEFYNKNMRKLLNELTWENTLKDLISFCEEPYRSKSKNYSYRVKGVLRGKIHYYLLKMITFIKDGRSKELLKRIMSKIKR